MRTLIRKLLRALGFKVDSSELGGWSGVRTFVIRDIKFHEVLSGRPLYFAKPDMTFADLEEMLEQGEMLANATFDISSKEILVGPIYKEWQVELHRTACDFGYTTPSFWFAIPKVRIITVPLAL